MLTNYDGKKFIQQHKQQQPKQQINNNQYLNSTYSSLSSSSSTTTNNDTNRLRLLLKKKQTSTTSNIHSQILESKSQSPFYTSSSSSSMMMMNKNLKNISNQELYECAIDDVKIIINDLIGQNNLKKLTIKQIHNVIVEKLGNKYGHLNENNSMFMRKIFTRLDIYRHIVKLLDTSLTNDDKNIIKHYNNQYTTKQQHSTLTPFSNNDNFNYINYLKTKLNQKQLKSSNNDLKNEKFTSPIMNGLFVTANNISNDDCDSISVFNSCKSIDNIRLNEIKQQSNQQNFKVPIINSSIAIEATTNSKQKCSTSSLSLSSNQVPQQTNKRKLVKLKKRKLSENNGNENIKQTKQQNRKQCRKNLKSESQQQSQLNQLIDLKKTIPKIIEKLSTTTSMNNNDNAQDSLSSTSSLTNNNNNNINGIIESNDNTNDSCLVSTPSTTSLIAAANQLNVDDKPHKTVFWKKLMRYTAYRNFDLDENHQHSNQILNTNKSTITSPDNVSISSTCSSLSLQSKIQIDKIINGITDNTDINKQNSFENHDQTGINASKSLNVSNYNNKCWCNDNDTSSIRSLGNSSISSPRSSCVSLDSDIDMNHRNGILNNEDDDDDDKILNSNGYYYHSDLDNNNQTVDNCSIDIPILSDSSEVVHSDASIDDQSSSSLIIDENPSNYVNSNGNCKTFFEKNDFSECEIDNNDGYNLNGGKIEKQMNGKCHRTLLESIDNRNDNNTTTNNNNKSNSSSHHRIFYNGTNNTTTTTTSTNNKTNNLNHINISSLPNQQHQKRRRKSNEEDQSIERKRLATKSIVKRRKTYHLDTENFNNNKNCLELNDNIIANNNNNNNNGDNIDDTTSIEKSDEELARRLQQEEYQASRPARRRVAIVAYDRLHEQLSKLSKKESLIDEILLQQQQQQQQQASTMPTTTKTTTITTSKIKRSNSSNSSSDMSINNDNNNNNNNNDCKKLNKCNKKHLINVNNCKTTQTKSSTTTNINNNGNNINKSLQLNGLKKNFQQIAKFFDTTVDSPQKICSQMLDYAVDNGLVFTKNSSYYLNCDKNISTLFGVHGSIKFFTLTKIIYKLASKC